MMRLKILLVAVCLLWVSFIATVAYVAIKSLSKNKQEVKILIYEGGYIHGAKSGAKYLCSDSLTFNDWLEIKKQDSIKAIETYNGL